MRASPRTIGLLLALPLLLCCLSGPAQAADWYVAAGATGTGTASSPFGRIQDGLAAARPGDTVHIAPGTYQEVLRTVRHGSASQRITVRAASGRGSVLVTMSGRVLTISHAYVTIEGLVLDGQYGTSDLVRVEGSGNGFTLRDSEVRRTSRDAIDMGAPSDVLIEDSLVHHALNAAGGRTDAHGIVAGAVKRLTIRNTEIHTFSGDGVQVDPGRAAPGWTDVVIEGCRIWLAPLPSPQNGFPAGTVPGENALDTKAAAGLPRARITVRDTEAFGYRGGLINNMAAFNLKEHIDAVLDRVTVYDSEIAFRLRGGGAATTGAEVVVQNAVVYNTATAFRYEDNIQNLRVWNVTVGSGVPQPFRAASSSGSMLDVRNFLILGSALPAQAAGVSNLAVPASAFVDAKAHNYQLASDSPAIDGGVPIPSAPHDRQGTPRPQGAAYDIGAYERAVSSAPGGNPEIALHAWRAGTMAGNWMTIPDNGAAGGARLATIDQGAARIGQSEAKKAVHYFEVTFSAEAGLPYRLWVRGRAERDDPANDSVHVQFSGSVDGAGKALYRIGTSSTAVVEMQRCSRPECRLTGWGWQDNGTSGGAWAGPIYFAQSGPQTIRILTREDGMSIDQIVLSPAAYLTTAPGPLTNDTTILLESGL